MSATSIYDLPSYFTIIAENSMILLAEFGWGGPPKQGERVAKKVQNLVLKCVNLVQT